MSACLKTEWIKKTLFNDKESENLESAIKKFAKGLSSDKPILLFFGSSKKLPVKEGSKKKPALTKQAKKSQELAECFNDKAFKVQVALKFFTCYDIDVSNISEEESPLICHENAPLLAVYHNGEILKIVKSASSSRLYGLFSLILKQIGYDINTLNKQVNRPLRSFYNTERKLYFKKKEFDRINSDYTKDPKNSKKIRFDKIKKEYEEIISERDSFKSEFTTALNEYLKNISEN